MKDRGKRELEAYNNNGDCFGDNFPGFPCKKHPASSSSSSSGGICAYCLSDRLVQLVCPECGEQRLSSCSCSEISSNPNSNPNAAEVGSVGRISFLIENEKVGEVSSSSSISKPKFEQKLSIDDDFVSLKRSNSTCVDMARRGKGRSGGFWKIGRLFGKRREKINGGDLKNSNNQNDDKSEMWVSDCVGVSRSRSLCSFRGFYDTEESGGFAVSSSAARASSVSTGNFMLDSAKRSCFSESEARISNFDHDAAGFVGPNYKNIFSLKETEFSSADDPAFIDLKLHDLSSSSSDYKPDNPGLKRGGLGLSTKEFGFIRGGGDGLGHEMFQFKNNGGSCRISVCERELSKCRKSYKVWRWFFRHQSCSRKRDDQDLAFKS